MVGKVWTASSSGVLHAHFTCHTGCLAGEGFCEWAVPEGTAQRPWAMVKPSSRLPSSCPEEMQKVQGQASVPGRGFSRSEAGPTPHAHPGMTDSPLKGYVLFSRAWLTANTKPVGEAERAGKCHLRKELPWGPGKNFRILLRGQQVCLATFFEGLRAK